MATADTQCLTFSTEMMFCAICSQQENIPITLDGPPACFHSHLHQKTNTLNLHCYRDVKSEAPPQRRDWESCQFILFGTA